MIRFTDTETEMIYQIDEIDGEIHLYYRAGEESSFRVVPMSPSAAAVLGRTLQRYVMPAAAARPSADVLQFRPARAVVRSVPVEGMAS